MLIFIENEIRIHWVKLFTLPKLSKSTY